MAIHRTLWTPDTCDCSIEYEWDDAVDAKQRTHTAYKVHKVCEAHQHKSISDHHEHYKTILAENQSKNAILEQFMNQFPEHVEVIEPEVSTGSMVLVDNVMKLNEGTKEQQPTKQLKPNIQFLYGWTGEGKNRILHVKFKGAELSDSKKKSFVSSTQKKLGHKIFNLV
jgi:hypothetical protein